MNSITIHVQGFPKTTRARDLAEHFYLNTGLIPCLINLPKSKNEQQIPFGFISFEGYFNKDQFFYDLCSKIDKASLIINSQVNNYALLLDSL